MDLGKQLHESRQLLAFRTFYESHLKCGILIFYTHVVIVGGMKYTLSVIQTEQLSLACEEFLTCIDQKDVSTGSII